MKNANSPDAHVDEMLAASAGARGQFLELVAHIRPELHRYCARMAGSAFDGEDVVQDTLAKAWYALSQMEAPPPLRPWLFRIAHNTAMDFLRRHENRRVDHDVKPELVSDLMQSRELETPAFDDDRVHAALAVFTALPPVQRSALVLKDVLDLSLEETALTMGTSVAAVKGALVRARANVRSARTTSRDARDSTTVGSDADVRRLRRYAELFNARDWDGLRALFGEETRLDLVSRHQLKGAPAAQYFTRYAALGAQEDLRAEAGWAGDVPVIAIFRPSTSVRPAYFIRIDWDDDLVALVRDFRHVPYIAIDTAFTKAVEGGAA